ncbi:conserved Plasmodium protein, unknown function [Plasmodium gallinaceum]|uniref:Uncharacterized protein n=1 Tax=Plasmodium gallinaceum TaxID=5849 RepID=A0A1J1GQM2_PLAGA|nr:conserved Plasmodium protein, unknown function [Plasmodium gallinaceum]CRG94815.1 conserved Plasmodium protein, unknown function [Plasmodium gallinaceum]
MCYRSNQMYASESKCCDQLDKYLIFLEKLKLHCACNSYFNENKLNTKNETKRIHHHILYDLGNTYSIFDKNFKKEIEEFNKFLYYENNGSFLFKENCRYNNKFKNVFQNYFYDKININTFSNYIIPKYNKFYKLSNCTLKKKEDIKKDITKKVKDNIIKKKIEKFPLIKHDIPCGIIENNKKINICKRVKNRKSSYLNSKKLLNKYFNISNILKRRKHKIDVNILDKNKKDKKENTENFNFNNHDNKIQKRGNELNLPKNSLKISNDEKIKFLKKLNLNFNKNKNSSFNFFLFLNNLKNEKKNLNEKESFTEDFENKSTKSEYLENNLISTSNYEKINRVSCDDIDFYKLKRKEEKYIKMSKLTTNCSCTSYNNFQIKGILLYKNTILNALNLHKKAPMKKDENKKKNRNKFNEKNKRANIFESSSVITKMKISKNLKIKKINNSISKKVENLKNFRTKKLYKNFSFKNLGTNNIRYDIKRSKKFISNEYSNNLKKRKSIIKNNSLNVDDLSINSLDIFVHNKSINRNMNATKIDNHEKIVIKEKNFYSDSELKNLNNINENSCKDFLSQNNFSLPSFNILKNYNQEKNKNNYRNRIYINDKNNIEVNNGIKILKNVNISRFPDEQNNENKNLKSRNENINDSKNDIIQLSRSVNIVENMYNNNPNVEMKNFSKDMCTEKEEKGVYYCNEVKNSSILKKYIKNLEMELLNIRKNCDKYKDTNDTIMSNDKNSDNSCCEYAKSKKINEDRIDLSKYFNEVYSQKVRNQDESKFYRTCSTTCTSSCKSEVAQKNDFYNKQENLKIIRDFRKIESEENNMKKNNYDKKDEINIENNYIMNNEENKKIFKDGEFKKLCSLNTCKENKNVNLKEYLEENNFLKLDSNNHKNSNTFLCCDNFVSTKKDNEIFNYFNIFNEKIINKEKIISIRKNDNETQNNSNNTLSYYNEYTKNVKNKCEAVLYYKSNCDKNPRNHILNEDNFNKINRKNYFINKKKENKTCVNLEESKEYDEKEICSYNKIEIKKKKKNTINVGINENKKKNLLKPKIYWCKKGCFFELKYKKDNKKVKEVKNEEILSVKKCKNKYMNGKNFKYSYEIIHSKSDKSNNNNINISIKKNVKIDVCENFNNYSDIKNNPIIYYKERKPIKDDIKRSKKSNKEKKNNVEKSILRENKGRKNNKKSKEHSNNRSEKMNNIYTIRDINNKLNDNNFNEFINKNDFYKYFEKNIKNNDNKKSKNNTSNILNHFFLEKNNQDNFNSRKNLSENITYLINLNKSDKKNNFFKIRNELEGDIYYKNNFLSALRNNKKNELSSLDNIYLSSSKLNYNKNYIKNFKENNIAYIYENKNIYNNENFEMENKHENNINDDNEINDNISFNKKFYTINFDSFVSNNERNKIILDESLTNESNNIYNSMSNGYSNDNFIINNSTNNNKILNDEMNLDIKYSTEKNKNVNNSNRTNSSYKEINTMNDIDIKNNQPINIDIYDKNSNNYTCENDYNNIKKEYLNSIEINMTNTNNFDLYHNNNENKTSNNDAYLEDIYNNMNNNTNDKDEIGIKLLNIKNSNFKNMNGCISENENLLNDKNKNIKNFLLCKNITKNDNNKSKTEKSDLKKIERNILFSYENLQNHSDKINTFNIDIKNNDIININNVNLDNIKNSYYNTFSNSEDNNIYDKLVSRDGSNMKDSNNNIYNIININNDLSEANNSNNTYKINNINNLNMLYSTNREENINSDNIHIKNNLENNLQCKMQNNETKRSNDNYLKNLELDYCIKEENKHKEETYFSNDIMKLSKFDNKVSNNYDKQTKKNVGKQLYKNLEYDNERYSIGNSIKEIYINNDKKRINITKNNEYNDKKKIYFHNKNILNNVYIKNTCGDEETYICKNEKCKNDIIKYKNNGYLKKCDNLSYSNYNLNNSDITQKTFNLFQDSKIKKEFIYIKKEVEEENEEKEKYFIKTENNKNSFIYNDMMKKENTDCLDVNILQNINSYSNKNTKDENMNVNINIDKSENDNENLNFFRMKTDIIQEKLEDVKIEKQMYNELQDDNIRNNHFNNENNMNLKLFKLNISNYLRNELKNTNSIEESQETNECSKGNSFINENIKKKRDEYNVTLNEETNKNYPEDSSLKYKVQNISDDKNFNIKRKESSKENFQNNLKKEMEINCSKDNSLKSKVIKRDLNNKTSINRFFNYNSHNNFNIPIKYEPQNNLDNSFSYDSQNNLKNIYIYKHEKQNNISNSFNSELRNNMTNSFNLELQDNFTSSFNDNLLNNSNNYFNDHSHDNLNKSFKENSSINLNNKFNDNLSNNLDKFFNDSSSCNMNNSFNDSSFNNMNNIFNNNPPESSNNPFNDNLSNNFNNSFNENTSYNLCNLLNDNSSNNMNKSFSNNLSNNLNNSFNNNSSYNLNNSFNDNSTINLNNSFNDNLSNSLNNSFNDNSSINLKSSFHDNSSYNMINSFNDNSTTSLNNNFNDNSTTSLNNNFNDNSTTSLNNNFNDNLTTSLNNSFNDNSLNNLNNSINDNLSKGLNNSINDNLSNNIDSSFNIESKNNYLIEWYPGFDIPIGTNGRAILRKALHQKRMTNVKKCDELLSSNNLYPTSRSTFGDMKIRDLYRAAYILGVWNVAEKYCLLACERNGYKKEWIYMLKKNGIKITVKALKEIRNNHILNNKKLGNLNKKKKNSKNETCKKVTDSIKKGNLEKNYEDNNFLNNLITSHNANIDRKDAMPNHFSLQSNDKKESFSFNSLEECKNISLMNIKNENNIINKENHIILQNETKNGDINASNTKYKRKYKKNKNKEYINKKIDEGNSSSIISEGLKNPNIFSTSKINNQNINYIYNFNNFNIPDLNNSLNNSNVHYSIKNSYPNTVENTINNKICDQLRVDKNVNFTNTNLLRKSFYNTNKNLLYEKSKDDFKNYSTYYLKNNINIANNKNINNENINFNNINYIELENINKDLYNTNNLRNNMANNFKITNHLPFNNFVINSQSDGINGDISKNNFFNNILPDMCLNNYNNFKNLINEVDPIKYHTSGININKDNFIYPIITINNSNNKSNTDQNLNILGFERRSNLNGSINYEYLQKRFQNVQL